MSERGNQGNRVVRREARLEPPNRQIGYTLVPECWDFFLRSPGKLRSGIHFVGGLAGTGDLLLHGQIVIVDS